MRKLIFFVTLLIPALGWAEPLRVFVSVLPQRTFVEKVGGDHVEIQVMVRPGYSPATYNPTPRQISALAAADLYIRAGTPFEDAWMQRIRSVNPSMRVLDPRAGIDLRKIERHVHPERDHHHSGGHRDDMHPVQSERDPHVWTSPPLVKRVSLAIRDTLTELDPENSRDYADNYSAFAAELDALDRDIRALLQDVPTRKFMVFHPAWGYFADTYGLIQVPIEKEGKEPGPRSLTALIEHARRENVRVIFVQPQFDKQSAKQVARAIGGRVVAIDPLAPNYGENLRNVARQIGEAMQQ